MSDPNLTFPTIARVRQRFDQPEVADVPAAVAEILRSSRIGSRVKPGGTVALPPQFPQMKR